MSRVNVAIAGGGPAGAALAILLRRAGASVAIVERSDYAQPRVGETVPGRIVPLLAGLGVLEAFRADAHAPATAMLSCWGSGEASDRPAMLDAYGGGWHLDRRRFDLMLVRAAVDAGAQLLRGSGIASGIEAELVVDATGRAASVARAAGAKKLMLDRLVGVVAIGDADLDGQTAIEATPDGWWYSAALPDGQAVFAYMTDADLIDRAPAKLELSWRAALARAPITAERARALRRATPLRIVSAASHTLDAFHGHRWLAIGDAALAFDPLTGQGICKGLESAAAAARAILSGDRAAFAQWHFDALHRYCIERFEHYAMERRWPSAPFWMRRGGGVEIGEASSISVA